MTPLQIQTMAPKRKGAKYRRSIGVLPNVKLTGVRQRAAAGPE
jgi:hypothetical protein